MSRYCIDSPNDEVDVCLGYDDNIRGFWLFIQDHSQNTPEQDFYLFHNLNDVPGFCMSIPMLEETLERFGFGLDEALLQNLVGDALIGGYVERLEEQRRANELISFQDICYQLELGSWQSRNILPCDWWGEGKQSSDCLEDDVEVSEE